MTTTATMLAAAIVPTVVTAAAIDERLGADVVVTAAEPMAPATKLEAATDDPIAAPATRRRPQRPLYR